MELYIYYLYSTLSVCPSEQWVLFMDRCYRLGLALPGQYIQWWEAESMCQSHAPGGHLVSIITGIQMTFLHYMLTTQWITNNTGTFIGGWVS